MTLSSQFDSVLIPKDYGKVFRRNMPVEFESRKKKTKRLGEKYMYSKNFFKNEIERLSEEVKNVKWDDSKAVGKREFSVDNPGEMRKAEYERQAEERERLRKLGRLRSLDDEIATERRENLSKARAKRSEMAAARRAEKGEAAPKEKKSGSSSTTRTRKGKTVYALDLLADTMWYKNKKVRAIDTWQGNPVDFSTARNLETEMYNNKELAEMIEKKVCEYWLRTGKEVKPEAIKKYGLKTN